MDLDVPFARLGKKVFFWARHPRLGRELWHSNGTARRTRLMKDIFGGTQSSMSGYLDNKIVRMGPRVFFAARDGRWGAELWKSDASRAGTKLVKDLKRRRGQWGGPSRLPTSPRRCSSGRSPRVAGPNSGRATERAGTMLVKDIWPGRDGSYPQPLAKMFRCWTTNPPSAGSRAATDAARVVFAHVRDLR